MVEAAKRMRDSVTRSWTSRTWKREVASLLLAVVWAPPTMYLLMLAPIDRMNASVGLYSIMTGAVFTFALGAFGFDAVVKQMGMGAPTTTPLPTTTGIPR